MVLLDALSRARGCLRKSIVAIASGSTLLLVVLLACCTGLQTDRFSTRLVDAWRKQRAMNAVFVPLLPLAAVVFEILLSSDHGGFRHRANIDTGSSSRTGHEEDSENGISFRR